MTACAASDAPVLPKADTPLSDVTFVAFDTETTGFGPKQNSIIEIGAVKFRNGHVLDERTWLIDPERPISYWAKRAHNITEDMLKGKPTFKETYPEFEQFIKGCVLIAHNATFDRDFMKADIARNGFTPPPNPLIDSLKLFRAWYPEQESHSLEPLTTALGIHGDVYHRATEDSYHIISVIDKWLADHPKPLTYGEFEAYAGEIMHLD